MSAFFVSLLIEELMAKKQRTPFLSKEHLPFAFLLIISIFGAYFYQSSSWLNMNGQIKPEWLLLIDGFIVLPILCFICIKNKKEASIKAIAYICLVVLLGSVVIPESSKIIWHYLESGRYIALAAFILFELTTIFTVIFAIRGALELDQDPDLAISKPIEKALGQTSFTNILNIEARVWTYLLFAKRINKQRFVGNKHFSYHNKDGTQANLLGFIIIICFELPVLHLLLHFLWSPVAANVTSLLTLLSLAFFIAEYKAVAIRPISISSQQLIIRYGIWQPVKINFEDIAEVNSHSQFVRRGKNIRRFNSSGNPNVKIQLHSGDLIYLGLDSPREFIVDMTKVSSLK